MAAEVSSTFSSIDTFQQFRQALMILLGKMAEGQAAQCVLDNIKDLMQTHVTNADRMNLLIATISDPKPGLKAGQRKSWARLYGVMGEVFEDSLTPYVPRILSLCSRQFEDASLHVPISDSIGIMTHHLLRSIADPGERVVQFDRMYETLQGTVKTSKKSIQTGVAMCITRMLQNSPMEVVGQRLPRLAESLLELLKSPAVQCRA
jgi:hypothetical protein